MNRNNHNICTYAALAGWLCFAFAWLVGALAPTIPQAWNSTSLALLCLNSVCWGIYGWYRVYDADATAEIKAFRSAIGALVPWLGFIIVMIVPLALGLR